MAQAVNTQSSSAREGASSPNLLDTPLLNFDMNTDAYCLLEPFRLFKPTIEPFSGAPDTGAALQDVPDAAAMVRVDNSSCSCCSCS